MSVLSMEEPPIDRTAIINERLAEGQAALWLSESLILALINNGIMDKDRMLEAVDVVIAAKREMAIGGREPEVATASIALLASISASIAAAKGSPSQKAVAARPQRAQRRKPRAGR
jgi:hypothetical protein